MKIGIIGLGKMGTIHKRVLEALKQEGVVERIRVHDKADVPENTGLDTLLKWADGVVVATPTPTHKHFVDMCIQFRKPVFCEKPFSDGYTDEDLYYQKWTTRRNPENKAMLFMGYIERYNAVLRRFGVILNSVENDPDDKVLYFSTRRVNAVTPDVMKGREIITDLGVHDFDMLRCLFGTVSFKSSRIIANKDKAVFAQSNFVLDGGVFCDSVISWIDTYKRREYVAYTTKKVITVDLLTQRITVLNRLNNKREEFTEGVEPAYTEMSRFLKLVENGEPLDVPDPLGLEAQKLAVEILENAEVVRV